MKARRKERNCARLLDALPAPVRSSDLNSYCIYCATWHFGLPLTRCSKCAGVIYKWVPSADLKLYRSRSSLAAF